MSKIKKMATASFLALLIVSFVSVGSMEAQTRNPVADVSMDSSRIVFNPVVDYKEIVLTVSGPNDFYVRKVFSSGSSPYFDLHASQGIITDGSYNYELRVTPVSVNPGSRDSSGLAVSSSSSPVIESPVQSGGFTVHYGAIANPRLEEPSRTMDIVHNDDVIIKFSACIGNDCVNGESFGFDTLRLKENNLRIHFDDTSVSASFPRNDWRIVANSDQNGGKSFFGIQDATAGRYPFFIEAAAPSNTLYVQADGDVGIKTSEPVVDLHIIEGNTPTLRLEQDGSDGFAPQTWDVAGNEANFFIRDVTNGSKLSFKIKPGAPENTLFLKGDGRIGQGTGGPSYRFHQLTDSSTNAQFVAERSGGARSLLAGTSSAGFFGTLNDFPVRITVNNVQRMELLNDDSLEMANGATCTAVGVWTNASSRELKENINGLSVQDAIKTINSLEPVVYNYKKDSGETYVGFIAEDVPELVAQKDRKTLSSMDVTAVLTRVVQEQQKTIEKLSKRIEQLEKKDSKKK